MKPRFVMYININREGWKKILLTANSQPLEYMIGEIFAYEEYTEVIIKYQNEMYDEPVAFFSNKVPRKSINISRVYELMPKKKEK